MKNTMKEYFEKSKKEYEEYIRTNNRRPTEKEWNQIAKTYKLLSSLSMRYIGNITFKKRIFWLKNSFFILLIDRVLKNL